MENKIAEVALVYRTKVKSSERMSIKSSRDAFEAQFSGWDKETIEHVEEFKILLLNRANKVLGISTISKGGITGTVCSLIPSQLQEIRV